MIKDENINISIRQMVALIILVTLFLTYSSVPFFFAETSPFYKYFTGPYRVIMVLFFIGCGIAADQRFRVPPEKEKTKKK